MLFLKVLIGAVIAWIGICIVGWVLFMITQVEFFCYPLAWTLWAIFTANKGN